jgi:hypothetical protein
MLPPGSVRDRPRPASPGWWPTPLIWFRVRHSPQGHRRAPHHREHRLELQPAILRDLRGHCLGGELFDAEALEEPVIAMLNRPLGVPGRCRDSGPAIVWVSVATRKMPVARIGRSSALRGCGSHGDPRAPHTPSGSSHVRTGPKTSAPAHPRRHPEKSAWSRHRFRKTRRESGSSSEIGRDMYVE